MGLFYLFGFVCGYMSLDASSLLDASAGSTLLGLVIWDEGTIVHLDLILTSLREKKDNVATVYRQKILTVQF
jgi:hypothetical protein